MHEKRKWLMAGVVVVGVVMLLCGAQTLRAQMQPGRAKPAYQYMGVDQTIARLDPETGRIEILSKRGEPRASLLMQDRKPWEWREVNVRADRATREDRGREFAVPDLSEVDEP